MPLTLLLALQSDLQTFGGIYAHDFSMVFDVPEVQGNEQGNNHQLQRMVGL
jgi:hypothetical protein